MLIPSSFKNIFEICYANISPISSHCYVIFLLGKELFKFHQIMDTTCDEIVFRKRSKASKLMALRDISKTSRVKIYTIVISSTKKLEVVKSAPVSRK